jgi:hypothetical protein
MSGSENEKDETKAKGGFARADSLNAEQRQEIARKAAMARWNAEVPQASHEGKFNIGDAQISAAVLPNGQRLLTQATFLRALGRSRSPKAGTGVLTTVDGIPFFLQAEVLKPFITPDLLMSTTPLFFRDLKGKRSVGYDAILLPRVAEVYLKLKDACLEEGKPIPGQYAHIVAACELVVRALATVGIIAMVDEATGYQEVRDRQALQAILDQYLLAKHAAWSKRFPDEFYQEIFRLRGWEWKGMKVNRPQAVAQYTKDTVWLRLERGILRELEQRNPVDPETGRRKNKHHQWLTDDIGHKALKSHLDQVVAIMRGSRTWEEFKAFLNRSLPIQTPTPLYDPPENEEVAN